MPPVIKKQIEKARKNRSFAGYVKLIPFLFFIGFLIVGWLVSLTALKIFKSNYQAANFCPPEIPAVFAGGDSEGCDSCTDPGGLADVACCGQPAPDDDDDTDLGCGEGCDDYNCGESCSSGYSGCCWTY